MSNPSPTNGELAIMLTGLGDDLKRHFQDEAVTNGRIEAKLDLTNGRVRKLEQWKYAMIGGMILGNLIFVPIIVSFIGRFILKA